VETESETPARAPVTVHPRGFASWFHAARLGDHAPLVLVALVGEYSLLIMPFILAAMMENYGLSEQRAGHLVSLQLGAMAVASIAVSARLRAGQSVHLLIAVAIGAISLANVACALQAPRAIFVAARALTGLGEGTVMAAAAAAVCATADPHRVFSYIGTAVAVVAALALVVTPWLTAYTGSSGIFWLLAGVPLLLLVSLKRIPTLSRGSEISLGLVPRGIRVASGALLLAFLLLWCGASGLWVYAERIGSHQGLTAAQIGLWLGIGQLAGVAGPLAAVRGGTRLGPRGALAGGCCGMAVAAVFFVFGGNDWLYGLGGCLASFWIMFVVPCFRSRMAVLDPSGRTVAASAGFYTVGFGAAPMVVAAITTEGQGYAPVAIFCVGCFLLSAALAGMASSSSDQAKAKSSRGLSRISE
jgi:predicted MFS family arabinose efflux permease